MRPPVLIPFAVLVSLLAGCGEERAPAAVRLATTTSVDNSGLLEVLSSEFRRDTGLKIEPFVVGSGLAMRMAERGEVDLILTHDPSGERLFVSRHKPQLYRQFMRNEFVIVGPSGDPARVAGAESAIAAFRKIAAARASFASRGDESGTHKRELQIWEKAAIAPDSNPSYVSLQQSMAQLLRSASELRAYTLTDTATYDRLRDQIDLSILFRGDPVLVNTYAVTLMRPRQGENPAYHANAARFADWLLSSRGREVVEQYRIGNRQQFQWIAGPESMEGAGGRVDHMPHHRPPGIR